MIVRGSSRLDVRNYRPTSMSCSKRHASNVANQPWCTARRMPRLRGAGSAQREHRLAMIQCWYQSVGGPFTCTISSHPCSCDKTQSCYLLAQCAARYAVLRVRHGTCGTHMWKMEHSHTIHGTHQSARRRHAKLTTEFTFPLLHRVFLPET